MADVGAEGRWAPCDAPLGKLSPRRSYQLVHTRTRLYFWRFSGHADGERVPDLGAPRREEAHVVALERAAVAHGDADDRTGGARGLCFRPPFPARARRANRRGARSNRRGGVRKVLGECDAALQAAFLAIRTRASAVAVGTDPPRDVETRKKNGARPRHAARCRSTSARSRAPGRNNTRVNSACRA